MNETSNTIINTPFSDITNELLIILNELHFLRADWFYAFIPLLLYLLLCSKKTQSNKNWQSVIDQKLLPFVLTKSDGKRRRYPMLLTFIAASLCITALAGPVYKKLAQPVYREQSSLIILLDLSKSMNAADVKPSRLSRARLELLDILKTRKTGQTALIVYAADAFVVTPLTDDNATIANLTPSLETDMMPAQGSNLSKALAKAFSLFNQAGIIKGNVLLITDGIRAQDESAIKKIQSQGHRLSIFGIGTTEGAPIPLHGSATGGFLQDNSGAIVIPKLQPAKLQQYALMGSGIYTSLKADESDTLKLTKLFQSKNIAHTESKQDTNADAWQEEGHWLLIPLLLFAALWARRGWIAALLPFVIVFTSATPQPAFAEETSYFNSDHLWSSPDQKAMQAFEAGDNKNAAAAFTQSDWKASALYRNGDYQQAAKQLENTSSSDGQYNRANALARLEQYKEAIKAYDKALELDKNNEDAKYNREQVQQALKKQQENSEQDKSEQDKEKQEENKDSENNDSGEQQDTGNEQNDSDKQEDNQGSEEQQSSDENKTPEQQQSADKELQQRDADKEREEEKKEQQQYEQDQKDQEQDDQNQQQSDSVENEESEDDKAEQDPMEIEINPMEASITEEEKATEQWLKRIPDDPGGLLRRKFLYQYKRKPNQTDTNEPW